MSDKELISIEEFRQFKKNIRASKDYLIVGLDMATDKHVAFMGTARGKTLRRRELCKNDLSGFNNLLEETLAVQKQYGLSKIVFGLEPTGNYHKPLTRWLIMQNHQLVMVSGKSVSDNRQSLDGRWGARPREGQFWASLWNFGIWIRNGKAPFTHIGCRMNVTVRSEVRRMKKDSPFYESTERKRTAVALPANVL